MHQSVIASLCYELQTGQIHWSDHFLQQLFERSQPDDVDVKYILCEDDPMVIERNDDDQRGLKCLIWGMVASERVAHIVCSYPPNAVVVTAYWPDTEPLEWTDNFKTRVGGIR